MVRAVCYTHAALGGSNPAARRFVLSGFRSPGRRPVWGGGRAKKTLRNLGQNRREAGLMDDGRETVRAREAWTLSPRAEQNLQELEQAVRQAREEAELPGTPAARLCRSAALERSEELLEQLAAAVKGGRSRPKGSLDRLAAELRGTSGGPACIFGRCSWSVNPSGPQAALWSWMTGTWRLPGRHKKHGRSHRTARVLFLVLFLHNRHVPHNQLPLIPGKGTEVQHQLFFCGGEVQPLPRIV